MQARGLRDLRAIAKAQRWQLMSLILLLVFGSLMGVFGSPLDRETDPQRRFHSALPQGRFDVINRPPGHWPDLVTVPLAVIVMASGLILGLILMVSNLALAWHLYPSYGTYGAVLLLLLLPYVSLFIWIVMQVHAVRVLRAAGVKIGLLGADFSSLPPPVIKT